MEKKFYCPNCQKEESTKLITKTETLNVKGQDITCKIQVRVCSICGEEIFDKEIDDKSLQKFYNQYRKKNNLLQPNEIKKIRKKYNLTQSAFSKLLGFGEKTITRYENGSIQDLAHDNLIRLMNSQNSFMEIWNLHKNKLTQVENENIIKCLEFTTIYILKENLKSTAIKQKDIYFQNFNYETAAGGYYEQKNNKCFRNASIYC